jgi:repressor of nif and glnA expression
MKKLEEHGLLKHLGNGVYIITERGEKYLDGKLDTSEDAQDGTTERVDQRNGDEVESGETGNF